MPKSCVVYGCNSRGKIEGITYHSFPTNEELRRQWVDAMKRKGWTPSTQSRLCSAHFREADLDKTLVRVRLREGVVPCIFPGFSNVKDPHWLKRKNVPKDAEVVAPQPVESPTKKELNKELIVTKTTLKKQNTKTKTSQLSVMRHLKRANLENIIDSLRREKMKTQQDGCS